MATLAGTFAISGGSICDRFVKSDILVDVTWPAGAGYDAYVNEAQHEDAAGDADDGFFVWALNFLKKD